MSPAMRGKRKYKTIKRIPSRAYMFIARDLSVKVLRDKTNAAAAAL